VYVTLYGLLAFTVGAILLVVGGALFRTRDA